MESIDVGVRIRDEYLILGYFKNWLVAQDQYEEFFVMDEPEHIYEAGTYCDADAKLMPANSLPKNDYESFLKGFLGEE